MDSASQWNAMDSIGIHRNPLVEGGGASRLAENISVKGHGNEAPSRIPGNLPGPLSSASARRPRPAPAPPVFGFLGFCIVAVISQSSSWEFL